MIQVVELSAGLASRCANCVKTYLYQQWQVMSTQIPVRQQHTNKSGFAISAIYNYPGPSPLPTSHIHHRNPNTDTLPTLPNTILIHSPPTPPRAIHMTTDTTQGHKSERNLIILQVNINVIKNKLGVTALLA